MRDRLIGCYQAVFPDLNPAQIAGCRLDKNADWDSLRAVVLLSVIEEEFKLRIPPNEIGQLQSFSATLTYITPLTAP